MEDAKWAKYAAIGGPWFVVLSLVGGLMPGTPPAPDDKPDKVLNFFKDNHSALKVGGFISALGIVGIIWWFGSLWRRMVDAEGGKPRMSVVAAIALAFSGAIIAIQLTIISTLAIRIDTVGPEEAQFFNTLSFVMVAVAGVGMLVFLAAVTSLSYRTKLFPAWINYLGWLGALAALIGTYGVATDAGGVFVICFVSFILFSLWILSVSWVLWREPATAGAGAVAGLATA